jgi:ATP-dependent DNA helicase Q1
MQSETRTGAGGAGADERLADIERQLAALAAEQSRLAAQHARLLRLRDGLLADRAAQALRRRESLEPDWASPTLFPWSERLAIAARDSFGFPSLRPEQLQAMNASMSGYDVFAVMKTGGGKSLCFQLPALLAERGFSLVVCPLLALIRDQVQCYAML